MPVQKTTCPLGAKGDGGGSVDSAKDESSSTWLTRKNNDATRHTIEGRNNSVTVGIVERLLLIQSIVVVTSPIGVQTPPALAATTTIAPNNLLSSSLGTNFLSKDTITIVTVKLFKIAERKNVKKPITQNNPFFDLVVIKFVTTLKP
mmetsp:Transcript_17693/g.28963  ORF Transcript_17693/g.28963 Transcript_17693/m.28963 type:complete len:147 (-) Transcript_17693:1226-1666(-)